MLKSAKEAIEIQKVKQLSKTKSATLNKPKKSRKSLVYIMSAAAVVGGMVFLSIYFDLFTNEKSNLQTANIAPVETVINTDSGDKVVKSNDVVEVTENQTNNTSIETTNNTEVKVIEPEVIKLTPPITSNFKVHVIAGSFSNLTNAENMQSEFQKSGFTSSILPISNGMYRVSVKSFADENQAIQEIEKLRTDTGNSALWVLCL
jgi:cell division protein FtsN